MALLDFCLVMDAKVSEQIAAISFYRSQPITLTIAALVFAYFLTEFTANAL